MMGEYHKFNNSIIGAHNYGLSEYLNGKVNMISNDYDISMTAQSKLNRELLLVAHRIDGLKVMKRDTYGKFEVINTVKFK